MAQLEAGRYAARVTEWSFGEAATGTYQIGIGLEITEPGFEGQAITYYGAFTEKSWEITVKAMRACGWTGADLAGELAQDGMGSKPVSIVVDHEQDQQGNWRLKVKWINPAGGVGFKKPLEGDGLKAFAAQMRGKILGADPGAARRTAQPRQQQAGGDYFADDPGPGADDIGF